MTSSFELLLIFEYLLLWCPNPIDFVHSFLEGNLITLKPSFLTILGQNKVLDAWMRLQHASYNDVIKSRDNALKGQISQSNDFYAFLEIHHHQYSFNNIF